MARRCAPCAGTGSVRRPRASRKQTPWQEHLATRLPNGVTVDFAHRSLAEAGRGLGIHFDFAKLQNLPDTREAHRLLKLAARDERQSEVADALFGAFFEQGRDIADLEVLAAVGAESGLTSADAGSVSQPGRRVATRSWPKSSDCAVSA